MIETKIQKDAVVVIVLAGPDHTMQSSGGFSTVGYLWHYRNFSEVSIL